MGKIRGLLLAAIGLLSGAALGVDAAKRGVKRAAEDFAEDFERARLRDAPPGPAAEPFPAVGRKGGGTATAELHMPTPPTPPTRTPTPARRAGAGDNFGTAPNRHGAPHDEKEQPAGGGTPGPAGPQDTGSVYTGTYRHDITLEHVHSPMGYLRELFNRFSGDFCPAWAASLSFFSILSIAPILLCALAVLGYVIHDPAQATARVEELMARVLPGNPATAQQQAADLIRQMNVEQSVATLRDTRGVAGVVGLLSLFWASMQIFVNASTPMNAAFRTRETRGWVRLRLVSLGLLLGAGLLFLLALVPSSGAQVINALHIPGIGQLPDPLPPILAFVFTLVGVAINAVMFAVIYRYLPSPSARVTWKAAWLAGGVVAVLWEIAKQGFAFYLHRFANYNKVYGSLGGLVGLIFWIYYTSMILLLGAEIAKLYLDAKEARQG